MCVINYNSAMYLLVYKFRKSENRESAEDNRGPAADDDYDTTNRESTGEPHQYEAIELHQHQDD